MSKSKIIWWILALLLLGSCIMDITSTMEFTEFESNPFFLITGKMRLLFILKLVTNFIMGAVLLSGRHYDHRVYYTILIGVVYLILIQSLATINNNTIANNVRELTPQQRAEIVPTPEIQTQNYIRFVARSFWIPIGLTMIIFVIYDATLKDIKTKEDEISQDFWGGGSE